MRVLSRVLPVRTCQATRKKKEKPLKTARTRPHSLTSCQCSLSPPCCCDMSTQVVMEYPNNYLGEAWQPGMGQWARGSLVVLSQPAQDLLQTPLPLHIPDTRSIQQRPSPVGGGLACGWWTDFVLTEYSVLTATWSTSEMGRSNESRTSRQHRDAHPARTKSHRARNSSPARTAGEQFPLASGCQWSSVPHACMTSLPWHANNRRRIGILPVRR